MQVPKNQCQYVLSGVLYIVPFGLITTRQDTGEITNNQYLSFPQCHSTTSQFNFFFQENMAQPDPLSSMLRDFITLSQLCFTSPPFLDHLIQHHQTEDAQAHIMPDACKIMIKPGHNLPESTQPGLKNQAFSRLHPHSLIHDNSSFLIGLIGP